MQDVIDRAIAEVGAAHEEHEHEHVTRPLAAAGLDDPKAALETLALHLTRDLAKGPVPKPRDERPREALMTSCESLT